ncbi:uncharacterized protein DEA37_0011631 [Paragonimus westermani]|uniref:Nucleolar protein 4 helical domain-containing protein n=1 Tax=Paragonimus westermani TaxID=34504 RepID=A0A5J4NM72_9TREM|nr:uncharacterized protein DEA37_0011631 [Paragonimus westermani]
MSDRETDEQERPCSKGQLIERTTSISPTSDRSTSTRYSDKSTFSMDYGDKTVGQEWFGKKTTDPSLHSTEKAADIKSCRARENSDSENDDDDHVYLNTLDTIRIKTEQNDSDKSSTDSKHRSFSVSGVIGVQPDVGNILDVGNCVLEEAVSKNEATGSELITAAYNNFVRRIVDETLDRTVTFCEQPRHAITTLEYICAKAWPQMENKRHRNRIRAYLKACRRNSKKNRGQINMKESPMNGLSIEARHMVSSALSRVTDDVDKLKRDDISYFLHNVDIAKEAIKYAKGVSRLIMKKVELLEGKITYPHIDTATDPLNLS